ncbi:MAG: hypothetical protein AAF438_09540 [Pseudomonadota bacterium]
MLLRSFIGFGLLAIGTASANESELTSRTVRLGNGDTIKHLYEDGVPVLMDNKHVKIELAGYQLGSDNKGVTWRWAFTLSLKENPPSVITVSDVTEGRARLLIQDNQGMFTGLRWFGQGDKFYPSAEALPWLYDSGTTQRIYRLDMRLTTGEHKVLYQPAIYTAESKRKILKLIKAGSIK